MGKKLKYLATGAAALVSLVWLGSLASADNTQVLSDNDSDSDWELPIEKQQELWDIEHFVHLFTAKVLAPLGEALQAGNYHAAEKFFRDDFQAILGSPAERVKAKLPYGVFTQASNASGEVANTKALLAWFDSERSQLTSNATTQLRIENLTPLGQQGDLVYYRGTLQWDTRGTTSSGEARTLSWLFEVEISIDPDASVSQTRILRRLALIREQRNTVDSPMFVDVTSQRGLQPERFFDSWASDKQASYTGGIFAADYDDDGWTDLLITDIRAGLVLMKNERGNFRDVTSEVGLGGAQRRTREKVRVAAWVDLDNDGDLDLIAARAIFVNKGNGTFGEIPALLGFPDDHLWGIVPGDFDRDGRTDLFLLYAHGQDTDGPAPWIKDEVGGRPNRLIRNAGGWIFEDVTAKAGVAGDKRSSFAAAWFDADQDLWPDLYVVNDFGENLFYVNQRDGTFKDVTAESGLGDFGTSMGVDVADYNGDGLPDVYVSNMFSGAGRRVLENTGSEYYSPEIYQQLQGANRGNTLYENLGGNRFRPAADQALTHRVGWAYAGLFADFDNNGWPDLYAPSGFISADRDAADTGPTLWRAVVSHPFKREKMDRQLGELNEELGEQWAPNPSQLLNGDFNMSAFEANRLFMNEGAGRFFDLTHVSGIGFDYDSRAVAVLDYNNDGRLDLAIRSAGGQPLILAENRLETTDNYLRLDLRSKTDNRRAIGAVVRVHLPDRTIVQQAFPSQSFMSQSEATLHIGLGNHSAATRVTVSWPNGSVEEFPKIPVNKRIRLTAGEAPLVLSQPTAQAAHELAPGQ